MPLNTQAQIELYQAAQRRQMEEQQKAAQRKAAMNLLGDVTLGGGSGYTAATGFGTGTGAASTALGSQAAGEMMLPALTPMAPTAASTSAAAAPAMGFSAGAAASVAAPLALYALATRPGGFGTADTTPRPWDPNRALKELDAFKLAPGLAGMSPEQQTSFLDQNKKFIGYRGAGLDGGKDIADIERDFPTSAWKVFNPMSNPFDKHGGDKDRDLLKRLDPEGKYGSGQGKDTVDWRRVPLETQAKMVMQDPRMSDKYKESVKKLLEDYNQKSKQPVSPPPKNKSSMAVDFGNPVFAK